MTSGGSQAGTALAVDDDFALADNIRRQRDPSVASPNVAHDELEPAEAVHAVILVVFEQDRLIFTVRRRIELQHAYFGE
jgi:hypothetical protein